MYPEYMALFQILDACYQKGANDDLPALLGEMSPYVLADSMPADKMVYDDWSIRSRDLQTAIDWKRAIYSLLEEYEKAYHFCFEDTKDVLNAMTEGEIDLFLQGETI